MILSYLIGDSLHVKRHFIRRSFAYVRKSIFAYDMEESNPKLNISSDSSRVN